MLQAEEDGNQRQTDWDKIDRDGECDVSHLRLERVIAVLACCAGMRL